MFSLIFFIEQAVELPIIWYAMTLKLRLCNLFSP